MSETKQPETNPQRDPLETQGSYSSLKDRWFVEGDARLFGEMLRYLRGDRLFLRALDQQTKWALRAEARRFGLEALVEDLNWFLRPEVSQVQLESALTTAETGWSALRLLPHFPVQDIPVVGMLAAAIPQWEHWIAGRAAQKGITPAAEFRNIAAEVLSTRDFAYLLRGEAMPSIDQGAVPADGYDDQDRRPDLSAVGLRLWVDLFRSLLGIG